MYRQDDSVHWAAADKDWYCIQRQGPTNTHAILRTALTSMWCHEYNVVIIIIIIIHATSFPCDLFACTLSSIHKSRFTATDMMQF